MTRAGQKGLVFFWRRVNSEAAEAKETCCSRIILTSVAKPGGRAQSGGGPNVWRISARSLSPRARVFAARAKLASVNGFGGIRKTSPQRHREDGGRTEGGHMGSPLQV